MLASTISGTPAVYGLRELLLALLPHLADDVDGIDAMALGKEAARVEAADELDGFRPQPGALGLP